MPRLYCPMCGSRSLQATTQGHAICTTCETVVRSTNSVTVIQPRPVTTA